MVILITFPPPPDIFFLKDLPPFFSWFLIICVCVIWDIHWPVYTPFSLSLFRLPHSSQSLFLTFRLFFWFKKKGRSETDLLCYDRRRKRGRPNECVASFSSRQANQQKRTNIFANLFSIQRSAFIIAEEGAEGALRLCRIVRLQEKNTAEFILFEFFFFLGKKLWIFCCCCCWGVFSFMLACCCRMERFSVWRSHEESKPLGRCTLA